MNKLLQIIEKAVKKEVIGLEFGGKELTELPAEIGQLVNLQELNLINNNLTTLSPEIGQLVNLQELNLTSNNLTTLSPEIGQLVNLQRLYLGGNNLTTFPPEIGQLVNLQVLHLASNELTTLPAEIGQLVNLRWINFYYNQLTTLPAEIGQLVNLLTLKISVNKLTTLPAKIAQLVNLQMLDLGFNQLMTLPAEIAQLAKKIEENIADKDDEYLGLYLKSNPLPIPSEILRDHQHPTKITNYFFQLKKQPLNEAKMLIVGQGGVGKTSLVNRLTKYIYNDAENKTEGIQIKQWLFRVKKGGIRLNIWDFGGQEIMHATHQFFLTKRSLYILVLDARQGEQESRVEYWLKLIQSFGGDSPIIIAINKTDEHPLDINKRGLKAKYPSLKTFFDISCKTNKGISELKENLKYQLDNIEHVHDPFPSDWFQVKQALENMAQDFIDYDEYVQMCQQQNVPDELSQHTLIDFLHDLGIVLNFREDKLHPQLRDTNILNPEWVTEGVYKLLNSFALNQSKGILKLEQLGTLLDQNNYPKDRQCIIIDIMEKFELCFEIKDSNRQQFLIPELLSKEEPDINWDYDNSLAFQYHYDILPSSIMSRFIVRMQKFISKKTYWHSGVVLAQGDNKALIKSDTEDGKIFIWVIGESTTRRKFLTAIRKQFEYLHKSIPKINAVEQVPYKTVVIPYKNLINAEEMGEKVIPIFELKERVPISQLLDGIEKIKKNKGSIPPPKNKRLVDVVIITALDKERNAVLRYLDAPKKVQIKHRTIYKSNLRHDNTESSYQVVLLCLDNMGNVAAGIATARVIDTWKPSLIILTGIMGGVKERNKRDLGDLIIPDQIIGYEQSKITDRGTERRDEVLRPDHTLLEATKDFDFKMSPPISRPDGKNKIPDIHWGPVASGEKVIADTQTIPELQNNWTKLIGVEMESYGAALAAYKAESRPRFLMVKGICDWANPDKNDKWQKYAAEVAAVFVVNLLRSKPFD
ncbi:COR domain-containing protein [Candidatus Parabeggiatoa sp. HSG14]|uniref:COR domain-containing protein n=1 Tax=Candidatus Parabeggiatoa sp. HSG14 TaxID=3055593 RepID=UPI0025A90308|nr:COR domain-containing protein [Thiotrichales bacterium HSG14]